MSLTIAECFQVGNTRGNSTDGTSFAFSRTLTAGRLYVVWAAVRWTDTAAASHPPTLSVPSHTPNLLGTQKSTGSSTSKSEARAWWFVATASGAHTFTVGNDGITMAGCLFVVAEFTGFDPTTPLRQFVSNANQSLGASATFSSSVLGTSIVAAFSSVNQTSGAWNTTASLPSTLVADFSITSPDFEGGVKYNAAPSGTSFADSRSSGTTDHLILAVEVAATAGGWTVGSIAFGT